LIASVREPPQVTTIAIASDHVFHFIPDIGWGAVYSACILHLLPKGDVRKVKSSGGEEEEQNIPPTTFLSFLNHQ